MDKWQPFHIYELNFLLLLTILPDSALKPQEITGILRKSAATFGYRWRFRRAARRLNSIYLKNQAGWQEKWTCDRHSGWFLFQLSLVLCLPTPQKWLKTLIFPYCCLCFPSLVVIAALSICNKLNFDSLSLLLWLFNREPTKLTWAQLSAGYTDSCIISSTILNLVICSHKLHLDFSISRFRP